MLLFIDTISNPVTYILFSKEREIIKQISRDIRGQESEMFLTSLEEFVTNSSCSLESLEGIVVINGPGSFTAMRIVTLTLNTLTFVHKTPLYALDYFQFLGLSGCSYPMAIKANRGEYLVQIDPITPPALTLIDNMLPFQYSGIGDINDFVKNTISIQ